MSIKSNELKVYLFSSPLQKTELYSLLGSKYKNLLSFSLVLVSNPIESDVIIWDGVMSPKMQSLDFFKHDVFKGKKLIFAGESTTLFKNSSIVRYAYTLEEAGVKILGGHLLPEDLMKLLDDCFQELKNV
jgi:Ni,Fe-hydrogenase III small subunit